MLVAADRITDPCGFDIDALLGLGSEGLLNKIWWKWKEREQKKNSKFWQPNKIRSDRWNTKYSFQFFLKKLFVTRLINIIYLVQINTL